MDLGSFTTAGSGGSGNCLGTPGGVICLSIVGPAILTVRSHITDNIVRFGLNYKFGGPVLSKSIPVATTDSEGFSRVGLNYQFR